MSKILRRQLERKVNNLEPPSNMTYQDFAKLRVGGKLLDDALLDVNALKKVANDLTDKNRIMQAIDKKDYPYLRDVSDFFYETSGMYGRLCRYLAYLFKYDWMAIPYVNSDTVKQEKILNDFNGVLMALDDFNPKRRFGDMALKVVKNGAYYGYLITDGVKPVVQELPVAYCRSRYFINDQPLVEFNVKFFDDNFRDMNQKMNVLKSFPKEFAKGYVAYKEGKLKQEQGDSAGWIVLDSKLAFKLSLNGSDMPTLIPVIPAIIDLVEAKEIDRKKALQELLKIVIQKMPLDKQGDLIFDVDEALDLHNNAVQMLSKAVNVDVLTTFADIEVADMADNNAANKDSLSKVERGVYNEAGVSQMLFATNGNLALEKSVANDEASMNGLVLQFEDMLNNLVTILGYNKNPKKVKFKVTILPSTIYNYKELAKLYKEQAMLGYSKMLPQIVLGQSQSFILATAHFENQVLDLASIMTPLQMSSTQSGKGKNDEKEQSKNKVELEEKQTGRPEKDNDEKSEKTIQNRESMS